MGQLSLTLSLMLFCLSASVLNQGSTLLSKLDFAKLFGAIQRMERSQTDFTSFLGRLDEGIFIFSIDETSKQVTTVYTNQSFKNFFLPVQMHSRIEL